MSKLDTRITIRGSKEEKQLIDDATKRIGVSFSQYIRSLALSKDKLVFLDESGSIAKAITKLDTLSPLKTLTRGYTLAEKDNKIVKSAKDLQKGDEIKIRFFDGDKSAKCI